MAEEKIKVRLVVEGNAKVELQQATKAVDNFEKETKSSFASISQIFNVFAGNVLANVFVGGLQSAGAAAKKFFDVFITQGIAAAQIQEDAINKLNIALKSSGRFSEEASKDLQEYASQLQSVTKFGDETILQTQALIQSLGQLDKEALKQATAAALDLSAALGIDLNSAALLVGKAAAGEVSTFSRYGVIIKKGASEAETFSNALAAINRQFGGAAQAQVKTFSGATQQLSNTFGDLQESFGFIITENQSLIAAFNEIGKILSELQNDINGNKDAVSSLVTDGFLLAIDGLGLFLEAIERVVVGILKIKESALEAQGVMRGFSAAIGAIDESEVLETAEALLETQRNIASIEKSEGLERLRESLERIKTAAENARDATRDIVSTQEEQDARLKELKDLQAEEDAIRDQEKVEKVIEARQKEIDALVARNDLIKQFNDEALQEELIANQERLDALLEAEGEFSNKTLQIRLKRKQETEKIEKERSEAGKKALNDLAVFTNAKSQELQAIGKAAAISSTIISTYEGAQKAFSSLAGIPLIGPALGAAAAAAAIASGLARVAAIQGTPLQTGLTEVPAGFPNDTFQARLTSGERVVDAQQNQDLKLFLQTNANNNEVLLDISERLGALENQIIVNIGGREIVNELRDASRGGRSIEVA